MKNIIKTILYISGAVAIGVLVFLQLKHNKETTAKITEMASIQGSFYPVRTLTVQAEKLTTNYSVNGFLKSETDLTVISETQGTIKAVYKEKGDYIKAGEVIAKVDDELLAAQLAAAKAAYQQLEKEVNRFTRLQAQNAVTSQKLEEIKLNFESAEAKYISAKRQLEDTKIKAPVSGFIENDFIEVGQFIGGGSKVCNIIDAGKLKLNIAISEQNYRYIQLGQPIDISSSIFPDQKFEGKITYIGKKADAGNKFDVEVNIINDTKNLLKAGMFVTASIQQEQNAAGIYIPRKAINGSLKDASVYIVENGEAALREVVTGDIIENQVEIISGIAPGDEVITEGNYSIYEGAKVKVMN